MAHGLGEIVVEANLEPPQAVTPARNATSLRVAVIPGVRFVRESLAAVLERDSLVSVVRLCTDLAEAAVLSPDPEADVERNGFAVGGGGIA